MIHTKGLLELDQSQRNKMDKMRQSINQNVEVDLSKVIYKIIKDNYV